MAFALTWCVGGKRDSVELHKVIRPRSEDAQKRNSTEYPGSTRTDTDGNLEKRAVVVQAELRNGVVRIVSCQRAAAQYASKKKVIGGGKKALPCQLL